MTTSKSPPLQDVRGYTMQTYDEPFEVLLCPTSTTKQLQKAAAALAVLPITARAWRTAVSAFPTLVELIRQPSRSVATRKQTLPKLLPHIAEFTHVGGDPVEAASAGVIASIMQLLKDDAVWVQYTAACILRELSLHPGNHARMMAAGGVDQLVRLLKSASVAPSQAAAAMALAFFFGDGVKGAECITVSGAVPRLVTLLNPGSWEIVQLSVVIALANICSDVANGRPSIVIAAGAAAPLFELLESRSTEGSRASGHTPGLQQ